MQVIGVAGAEVAFDEDHRRSGCPISCSLDLLGDKWSLLIVRDMVFVKKRFFQEFLSSDEGIATNILTDRLGRLEATGIVTKRPDPGKYVEPGQPVLSVVSSEGSQTINARYVVGADGMHSVVRQTVGIGFTGASYEESFVLADVEMSWSHGRDEVMLFFSPAGLVVVAPLPAGTYRIVATLDNAPEHPEIADIQSLLDARGPTHGVSKVTRVHWSSRFRLHHRVADQYRQGRFFLMGDAAHVHSPAGGQGMNTGLVDACVLGRLLADVVSGRKDDKYLDTYEAMRRPAAKQVLQLAGRLTHMATMKSAPKRFVRNLALRTAGLTPMFRRRLEMDLSGLSRRAAAELQDA